MNKENKQPRFLALVVFLLLLLVSWLFVLQPTLSEERELKSDLQSKQVAREEANAWIKESEQKGESFGVVFLSKEQSRWIVRGSLPDILRLLAFAEENGARQINLSQRKGSFVISW